MIGLLRQWWRRSRRTPPSALDRAIAEVVHLWLGMISLSPQQQKPLKKALTDFYHARVGEVGYARLIVGFEPDPDFQQILRQCAIAEAVPSMTWVTVRRDRDCATMIAGFGDGTHTEIVFRD